MQSLQDVARPHGADLVNQVFGTAKAPSASLPDPERQAMRDLLAGMYGVFRNKYAHGQYVPTWAETDATISMINHLLKELDRFRSEGAEQADATASAMRRG